MLISRSTLLRTNWLSINKNLDIKFSAQDTFLK